MTHETHYTIVAEAGTYKLEKSTMGVYRVWDGDKIVQENLTADDALRHAYHIMHGAFHLGNKLLRG